MNALTIRRTAAGLAAALTLGAAAFAPVAASAKNPPAGPHPDGGFGGAATTVTSSTAPGATTTKPGAAAKDARLAEIISKGDAAIAERLTALDQGIAALGSAKGLTDAHRSALSSDLTDAKNGLTTLKAKLDADTDPGTANTDARTIMTSYRVFALRLPRARLAAGLDATDGAVAKLNSAADSLDTAVAALKAAGANTAAIETQIAQVRSHTAAVASRNTGDFDKLMALTPAQIPDPGKATLESVRAALKADKDDLHAARDTAKAAAEAAKQLAGSVAAPTTQAEAPAAG